MIEGEGEGEGEPPVIEGEGETKPEGEGEIKHEGEGEEAEEGGCLKGCGCKETRKTLDAPRRLLGDWLLIGVSLVVLASASRRMN